MPSPCVRWIRGLGLGLALSCFEDVGSEGLDVDVDVDSACVVGGGRVTRERSSVINGVKVASGSGGRDECRGSGSDVAFWDSSCDDD